MGHMAFFSREAYKRSKEKQFANHIHKKPNYLIKTRASECARERNEEKTTLKANKANLQLGNEAMTNRQTIRVVAATVETAARTVLTT